MATNNIPDKNDWIESMLSKQHPAESKQIQLKDDFFLDASQGLAELPDKENIADTLLILKEQLNKLLQTPPPRPKRRKLQMFNTAILSVSILLMLLVLILFMINFHVI